MNLFRKKINNEEDLQEADEIKNIYWICLKEKCPKNCCGKEFYNGKVVSIFNIHHDQILLLLEEKDFFIKEYGPKAVRKEIDGMFYLNISKDKACPFFKNGQCGVQANKPSLCQSYPLIQLDIHVGAIFDYKNCPGFEYGKKNNIKMKKSDYAEMLANFIKLQQYRLDRNRLELRKITTHSNISENVTSFKESRLNQHE